MIFWLIAAAVLLYVTMSDIKKHKANTSTIFPWYAWFDVSRERSPVLYWTCVSVQLLMVVGCVVFAFYNPVSAPPVATGLHS